MKQQKTYTKKKTQAINEIREDNTKNLWNAILNKTKRVIQYIEKLEPPYNTYAKQCKNCNSIIGMQDNQCHKCGSQNIEIKQTYDTKKFDEIKEEALTKTTPDEMLKTIGYINHKTEPKIYTTIKIL